MPPEPALTLTYWGVTGTLAAPLRPAEVTEKIARAVEALVEQGGLADLRPGPGLAEAVRHRIAGLSFALRSTYGGNTTCVEVRTPDALIILDGGSGLRELGIELDRRWGTASRAEGRTAHVLISHAHMDHIFGIPYVGPFFDDRSHFTLWGTRAVLDGFRAVLDPASPLAGRFFPPNANHMKGLRGFRELTAGAAFALGSTRITTYALHHPGGCLAYRLERAGRVFVFATDHEQQEEPDPGLVDFARGADLLYTDGQYTRAEYEGRDAVPRQRCFPRRGWGHSPAEACLITAVAAGVRALHVGHRDPCRDDDATAAMEGLLRQELKGELRRRGRDEDACRVLIPYEGLAVEL